MLKFKVALMNSEVGIKFFHINDANWMSFIWESQNLHTNDIQNKAQGVLIPR